eukprot:bmy_03751T0
MPRSPPPQPRPPGLPPPLRLAPHPTSSSGSPRLKSLPEKRHLYLTLHREAEPPSCAAPRSPFWATHGGGGLRRGPEGEWGEGRKRKPSARVVEKKSPAVESHSRKTQPSLNGQISMEAKSKPGMTIWKFQGKNYFLLKSFEKR